MSTPGLRGLTKLMITATYTLQWEFMCLRWRSWSARAVAAVIFDLFDPTEVVSLSQVSITRKALSLLGFKWIVLLWEIKHFCTKWTQTIAER